MYGNVETVVGSTLYPFLRHADTDKILLMTVKGKELGCDVCISVNFYFVYKLFINKKLKILYIRSEMYLLTSLIWLNLRICNW